MTLLGQDRVRKAANWYANARRVFRKRFHSNRLRTGSLSAEPLERITKKIMDRYNRKPEGWNVLTDRRGNILVLGPKSSYMLRLISLGPDRYIGVGAKVGGLEKMRGMVEGTPPYGFRPLSKRKTQVLLTALQRKGRLEKATVKEILGSKPLSTPEIMERRPHAVLSGPVIAHPDLGSISQRQRELERKLALEAFRLFRKRHPLRAEIYG